MLSIVVTSRNDDHGENQIGRFQTFIDGIDAYRALYDWDVELVVVEWNPPPARPALEEALAFPAGLEARIYQVPPAIHNQIPNAAVVPVFFQFGQNAGIRRARGEWVLIASQDLLFADRLARYLALENLDRGSFYRAVRYDSAVRVVPPGQIQEQVALLSNSVYSVKDCEPDSLHTRACGDFILMHRDAWASFKAFPEYGVFGIYIDGLVLHLAYASGLTQVVFDLARGVYHIDHGNQGVDIVGRMPCMDYQNHYQVMCAHMREFLRPVIHNDDGWGLVDCKEEQVSEHTWRLASDYRGQRGAELPDPERWRPDF